MSFFKNGGTLKLIKTFRSNKSLWHKNHPISQMGLLHQLFLTVLMWEILRKQVRLSRNKINY